MNCRRLLRQVGINTGGERGRTSYFTHVRHHTTEFSAIIVFDYHSHTEPRFPRLPRAYLGTRRRLTPSCGNQNLENKFLLSQAHKKGIET